MMIDKVETAFGRVALAGRELGSGPAAVLLEEEFGAIQQHLIDSGVSPQYAGSLALGIVVGLVACEDEEAEAVLKRISDEWLATS